MGPYPFLEEDQLEKYLNRDDVKDVLNIKETGRVEKSKSDVFEDDFISCSGYIWDNFATEFHRNFISKMVTAVHNFKVLV